MHNFFYFVPFFLWSDYCQYFIFISFGGVIVVSISFSLTCEKQYDTYNMITVMDPVIGVGGGVLMTYVWTGMLNKKGRNVNAGACIITGKDCTKYFAQLSGG